MTNRPTMASITFDRFKFKSSRVTEFNMTRTVRRMDENSVKVAMLFTNLEFVPEDDLVNSRHAKKTRQFIIVNICCGLKR